MNNIDSFAAVIGFAVKIQEGLFFSKTLSILLVATRGRQCAITALRLFPVGHVTVTLFSPEGFQQTTDGESYTPAVSVFTFDLSLSQNV